MRRHNTVWAHFLLAMVFGLAQLNGQVNVTTWHNDNWRTGQNTQETTLKQANVGHKDAQHGKPDQFGLLCKINLVTGSMQYNQVYAQPLVIGHQQDGSMSVYVATMQDDIYKFAVPAVWTGSTCDQLKAVTPTNLLQGYNNEYPADCCSAGGDQTFTHCQTLSPTLGVLGTPAIDAASGSLFLIAESQVGSTGTPGPPCSGKPLPGAWVHRLHALDVNTLNDKQTAVQIPDNFSFHNAIFKSQTELQRPGLLLAPVSQPAYPTLYAAFSMMDGSHPQPSGWIFGYDALNLGNSLFPKAYATVPEILLASKPSGGIWQGGAGLAMGTDMNGGTYLYFSTADGFFDLGSLSYPNTDAADSFVKLDVNLHMPPGGYFTPSDQAWRQCFDMDYGSGGPILLPDSTFPAHSYAVKADKENVLWAIDRLNPGGYTGGPTCGNCNFANNQCYIMGNPCTACSNSNNVAESISFGVNNPNGNQARSTPAFWSGNVNSGDLGELYLAPHQGQLTRYPVCAGSAPICPASANTNIDPSGTELGYSTTPSVSSNGTDVSSAIVWGIKTNSSASGGDPAILYAFKADDLSELYDTTQCKQGGTLVDQPGPGEKFTVPTIANGYVFIGTQTDFDIYGVISPARSCDP
jgi:hypothetical protein